jgi:hypothetical protein
MEMVRKSGETCLLISMPRASPILRPAAPHRMKIIRSRFFFHEAKPVITSRGESRGVLLFLLYDGHVNEFVVPLSSIDVATSQISMLSGPLITWMIC